MRRAALLYPGLAALVAGAAMSAASVPLEGEEKEKAIDPAPREKAISRQQRRWAERHRHKIVK